MNVIQDLNVKVINIMNSCGFDVSEDDLDCSIEYDSLQFVSLMVEFESNFEIEIPEEYLFAKGLDTPRDFINMLERVLNYNK